MIFNDISEYKYTPRLYSKLSLKKEWQSHSIFDLSCLGSAFGSHLGPRGIQKKNPNPKPLNLGSISGSQKKVRQGNQNRIPNRNRNETQEGSKIMAFGKPKTIKSVKPSSNSLFSRKEEKKEHVMETVLKYSPKEVLKGSPPFGDRGRRIEGEYVGASANRSFQYGYFRKNH